MKARGERLEARGTPLVGGALRAWLSAALPGYHSGVCATSVSPLASSL